ncbi:hypothetical protein DXG01_005065 [Tephrocybe rancida]|nr:hypothetical protein DXG01_005065 [Tephrocybe rancida]
MNATIESLFGPPSEPIDVSSFIQAAAALDPDESLVEPSSAAEECNVDDFRDNLFEAWNNPPLSAHLSNTHDLLLTSLHSTTKTSKSKRKAQPPELNSLPPGVATLQGHLDTVKLTSWKYVPLSSQNKASREPSSRLSDVKQAIITVTVHNRSTWTSGYINRASQHVLLSSQTLRDLFQVIPCVSSEFPVEETLAGFNTSPTSNQGIHLLSKLPLLFWIYVEPASKCLLPCRSSAT